MFNLKKHSSGSKPVNLLLAELSSFDIERCAEGYKAKIGDEEVTISSLEECVAVVQEGTEELKEHLWEKWKELEYLSEVVAQNNAGNRESIDNILFLNNVKKSYLLSKRFDDLASTSEAIRRLFNIDINSVHNNVIVQFNRAALSVRLLHRLIMSELYRIKLIKKYQQLFKVAGVGKMGGVSGPWANLDLPMKERVWEWDSGEEEYFSNREKSRKEQTRYNPEEAENTNGFFFVWQDLTRSPYTWDKRDTESPYKSRLLIQTP